MTDYKEVLDYALQRIPDATQIYIKVSPTDGITLDIERGDAAIPDASASAVVPIVTLTPPPAQAKSDAPQFKGANIVKAELVGVFYASPSPDAPPFVTVGQTVKKGDVICIIEAMKMMNEIESPYDGTLTVVIAENGSMVEYGQPLFEIRP